MSEPKSKVVLNHEDMKKPVTPSCTDGQSYEPSEVASETNTSRPLNTFKAAFFNFMRDFKRNHRNKDYSTVIRLGARRWRAMTQAQRAPYVLEAAQNRKSENSKRQGSPSASKKRKRSKTDDSRASSRSSRGRPTTGGSERRCPTCGNRKRDKPKRKSKTRSRSASSSASSKSSN